MYFLLIMVVFFLAYGIPQQAILYPNEGPSWSMASRVFFRPYFQAHGELFLDAPDISKRFVFNRWIPSDGYKFVNMYSKIDVLSSVIVRVTFLPQKTCVIQLVFSFVLIWSSIKTSFTLEMCSILCLGALWAYGSVVPRFLGLCVCGSGCDR